MLTAEAFLRNIPVKIAFSRVKRHSQLVLRLTEILDGVHQVDGVNANSYLVFDKDGSLILIDTGMAKDGKKIAEYITSKLGRRLSDVRTIVLTHCHMDHSRGAASLKASTGAKLAIHEADADFVSGKAPYPSPRGFIGFFFTLLSPFFRMSPVEPDLRLKENDIVGESLMVVHTPGHTPGSIALYDKNRKVVLVGDTLRYHSGKIEGPPRRFTPDMNQARQSIQKISQLSFETMLSGHGQPLVSPKACDMVKDAAKSI